ncbi:hypothetical protein [Paenibacillus sp. 481]|uniref:hypothetical protein n=1 Tax=Paenibacillus sp. 481 TaxID=2835869 RepID=UPI001E3CE8E9|nr:hypothetical protein [Paenibacillus sp. 481]UHA73743.1 hypothetical protein KIK04_00785 [Paenibacillus sp. 481]
MKRVFYISSAACIGALLFFATGISHRSPDTTSIRPHHELTVDLHNIVTHSYYENPNYSLFSSVSMTKENPDLYTLYWTIKMINLRDNKMLAEQRVLLTKHLREINKNATNFDFNQLMMLMELNNQFNITDNVDYAYNYLVQRYDSKEGLFMWSKQEDSLQLKMAATYNAITLCKAITCQFDFSKVKAKLVKLLATKKLSDNVHEAFQTELIYLKLLHELEYPFNTNAKLNSNLMDWLMTINEQVSRLDNQLQSVILLSYLDEINHLFGTNNHADEIGKMLESLDPSVIYNGMIIEPQIYYVYTKLLHGRMMEIDDDAIDTYIKTQISSDFKRNSTPNINYAHNYYGVLLATEYARIHFNKQKMMNLLSDKLTDVQYLQDMSIEELYYFYLTNKQLNNNTHQVTHMLKERFLTKLSAYNSSIPRNEAFRASHLLSLSYVFFKSEHLLDTGYIQTVKPIVSHLLHAEMITNSDIIFDIVELSRFISATDEKTLMALVNHALASLFDSRNGGFKKINEGTNESDVGTTHKIVTYLLKHYSYHDINQTYKINDFIAKISKIGRFVLMPSHNSTDLRTMYDAMQLAHYAESQKE